MKKPTEPESLFQERGALAVSDLKENRGMTTFSDFCQMQKRLAPLSQRGIPVPIGYLNLGGTT